MRTFILILALIFSGSVFADAISDAKTVVQILTTGAKTNAQILSIATKYAESYGSQWANPWDETDNPDEFAAWPTNTELAEFFLLKMRAHGIDRMYKRGLRQGRDDADAAIKATAQAYADEF